MFPREVYLSSGQALPQAVRAAMEELFGADLREYEYIPIHPLRRPLARGHSRFATSFISPRGSTIRGAARDGACSGTKSRMLSNSGADGSHRRRCRDRSC